MEKKRLTTSKYLQERKNTSKGKYIVKAEDQPLKWATTNTKRQKIKNN